MQKQGFVSVVDPTKYVVLDVETNGLSSINDDLLSISIYMPDTGKTYNRFLPLELNYFVVTTWINGIKTEDLEGLSPLSQDEVDELIRSFELNERIILTYGNLDERFMVKYFQRHHLYGIESFTFYNFKHEIISSQYSEGNITKDNLCNLYGIENVSGIHSGINDCILEWKLYERMNGHRLLITDNKVFEFNDEYIVPASYISTYPNLKYYLPHLPKITCEAKDIYSLTISAEKIVKFPTNVNGMIVEHLVNSMLQVQEIDSKRELLENKKRLNYLGKLPSSVDVVPMVFNDDGSVTATRSQDKEFERELNEVIDLFEVEIKPLIKYIRDSIFHGKTIKSQELVIQAEKRVLALCDLSSEDSVLEIKTTFGVLPDKYYADQFYYEANGRKCYVLRMDWFGLPKEITFYISEIIFDVKEYIDPILERFENAKKRFETDDIELVSYVDSRSPLRLKCKKCGHEWNTSYWMASEHHPCPNCNPRVRHELSIPKEKAQKPRLTEEEKAIRAKVAAECRLLTFRNKISERSHNNLEIIVFNGSRSPAKVKCLICGHEWDIRSDHLLSRPYCPVCKRNGLWPEK